MQYHSSARPRHASGLPLYLTPEGYLAVIPPLTIRPTPEGTHEVGAMLLVRPNESRWHHCTTGDLAPLLDAWGADPEGTMAQEFGWRWLGAPAQTKLSLEDLLA